MKNFLSIGLVSVCLSLIMISCDNSEDISTSMELENDTALKSAMAKKGGAKEKCATIQSGTILDDDGNTIQVGFNQSGYNYQAKTYYGERFPESSPGWYLKWKWNDAFLSTQDCDGDQRLDIANGQDSYRGTGAWTTTKWTKKYTDGEDNQCIASQFSKFVAVPVGANAIDGIYYTADGVEIGQVVLNAPGFEDFARIQLIWNDPCNGINGVAYKAPGPVGLGNR